LIKATAISIAGIGTAGCSDAFGSLTGGTPTGESDGPEGIDTGRDPSPTVEWSETYVDGGYRITVDVQLDTLDKIHIKSFSGNNVTTIRSNGKHTIFGPNTDQGLADTTAIAYKAVWIKDGVDDMPSVEQIISSHTVGSEETPSLSVLLHLDGLKGHTGPDLEDSGFETKKYQQGGLLNETELTLRLPTVLKKYYSERTRIGRYGAYVSDRFDDPYLDSVVGEFKQFGEENSQSDPEIIDHMMRFVQNLKYSNDKVSEGFNEYPKFPIETLVDKGGDCEDTCILLASMLEQFGYGTVLLAFFDRNHMAVGVAGKEGLPGTSYNQDGTQYYYVETTASGWRLGQVPPKMKGGKPKIIPVDNQPVLVFVFAVDAGVSGEVKIETSVSNYGDAPATNASIQGIFETPNDKRVAADQSKVDPLNPEEETKQTLNMSPPSDFPLRLRMRVGLGNRLHDEMVTDVVQPTTVSR